MPRSSPVPSVLASRTERNVTEGVMRYSVRRRAIAASVVVLGLAVGASAQAPAKAPVKADGLLHTELSLLGRTASISFAPDLHASDPAHRNVFASPAQGRVRLGQLQTNGALRLGNVSVGKPGATPLRFDLCVEGTPEGWQ